MLVLVMVVMAMLVLVMVMMAMLMLVMVMMAMLMLVMVMMAMLVLVMVVMAMLVLVMVVQQMLDRGVQRILALDRAEQRFAGQLGDGRGHDHRRRILFPHERNRRVQLFGRNHVGMTHDDRTGMLHLVIKKLSEVFHVHLALAGVHDRRECVERNVGAVDALHGLDHVGQFADAGRLDQNSIGRIGLEYLPQRFSEVADEAAANAAGIHFRDFDAGVLHEAAVDADLAELVFDQHKLFIFVTVGDQLFDERRFSRAEKTGKNIDLCHTFAMPSFPNLYHVLL